MYIHYQKRTHNFFRNTTHYFTSCHLRDYNYRIVLYIVILAGISMVSIYQISPQLMIRQGIGFCVGFTLNITFSLISYNFIAKRCWILYIINIGILSVLLLIGTPVNGSVRWFSIGGLGTIQPSEFTKIFMVIFTASFFGKEHLRIQKAGCIFGASILYALPLVLILAQPDLSTVLILTAIFIIILFDAGLDRRVIIAALILIIPICIIFIWYVMQPGQVLLHDYQKQRLLTFLNPSENLSGGYAQQYYSLIAIGSGQLTGQQFKSNISTSMINGNYISEPQTDFIFAVIGEQFGFVGSAVTILLILAIVFECLYIGRHASDTTGALIACGVAAWIGCQAIVNLGVVMSLLPNTGLPLPFVSYGLSSIFSLLIGTGIVLNVGLQKNRRVL